MGTEDLAACVGELLLNLQSLEFLLRLFLYNSVGPKDPNQHFDGLEKGQRVRETPLTNYDSLHNVVTKANARLREFGASEQIDAGLVELRNGIAHGRLLANKPEGPYTLFKFSRAAEGCVTVETVAQISPGWAKHQTQRVAGEMQKLERLARSHGLPTFPE